MTTNMQATVGAPQLLISEDEQNDNNMHGDHHAGCSKLVVDVQSVSHVTSMVSW